MKLENIAAEEGRAAGLAFPVLEAKPEGPLVLQE